ncbi:MAG: dicarboxylate/amino acid:cation symporter [Planctomycetota bacterium]
MSGSPMPGSSSAHKNLWTRIPLSFRILGGVALGILTGNLLGGADPASTQSVFLNKLGDISKLFIDLLKALATPLIFFAVIDALVRTHIPPRKGFKLVCISLVNAVVAISIGLFLANTLRGGDHWKGKLDDIKTQVNVASHGGAAKMADKLAKEKEKTKEVSLDFGKQLESYIPKNFVDPFQGNNIISVVLIAIFAGAALRRLRNHATPETEHGVKTIEDGVQTILQIFTIMLGWVIEIIPLAIFGIVAKVVGDTGGALFQALGYFLGIVMLGLFLHAFVYYSFLLAVIGRRSPLEFYRGASEAIVTSLSCGSSLATLPVTLRCLKDKLKISDGNARLAACVGTNLNHDGIILYEAAATIFIAQAIGMELTTAQQLTVAFASIMAGIGIAGVPEAGLITLQLVLTAGGIPQDKIVIVLPLLFTVDWIIGRGRAMTNVISDMTVATLLERLDPEEVIQK